MRSARTIIAIPADLEAAGEPIMPAGVVPFPHGFAFGSAGRLFLASGVGPSGEGDDTVVAFAPDMTMATRRFVSDLELSPLDLAIAPNHSILVASEGPFGAPDAVTTIREYDAGGDNL